LFDRYTEGKKAVLVHIRSTKGQDMEEIQEFENLASSAGFKSLQLVIGISKSLHPKYFVGQGKAYEICDLVRLTQASTVLFNHALKPAQERNLESLFKCRVMDRTNLILSIFSQRAVTYEGKLQVELAKMRYVSTRLVHVWKHLERQRGGLGLRGPGEAQLECDRRLVRERMNRILYRLKRVGSQREQGNKARSKANLAIVSLVGYTNAGKSTLFNTLTTSNCITEDKLFSTLDPILRRLKVDNSNEVVLADTIGFIRHLPHDLVAAFKTTLQQICHSRLLLHVVDATDPRADENIKIVNAVLRDIGADKVPVLIVMNKIDQLHESESWIDRDTRCQPKRIWLSAQSKLGVDLLYRSLSEILLGSTVCHSLHLPPSAGRLRSLLYQLQSVKKERVHGNGVISLHISTSAFSWHDLCKKEPSLIGYVDSTSI
jgi:GTP-binding protein HflX